MNKRNGFTYVFRIALGITMLLLLLGGGAEAAPSVSVVPSSSTVNIGDTFTINILVDPQGIETYGAQFDLIYISSILNATGIVAGPFLTQDGASSLVPIKKCNNSISKCEYAQTRMGVQNGITTPGILATITFRAVAAGIVPLNLENVGLADTNANSINLVVFDGTIIVQRIIPPTPTFSPHTQGNFWINQTWLAGSGKKTDSYYVKLNGIWTNGTTATFKNITVAPHGWSNISVWAYNNSGELSKNAALRNIQLANNAPVMNDIPDKFVSEGQTLNFTITSIDADSDPLTYTTNATKGSLNMTSGQFIWKPAYSDSGVYFWIFTANDGYGGTATKIVKITVNIPPVAICGLDKLKCENVASLVQFNGTASYDPDGTIVLYYWEFDDGTTSLDSAPVHIYNNYKWNGSAYLPFMVNLTVIDNKGASNSTSQKVIIWIKADANGDGKVDIFDASTIGIKWGSNNPCADLNNDGIVNIIDAVMIGLNWGSSA
jgi:hypothetical protein